MNPFQFSRTIVSALYPRRHCDSYTEIIMLVWFEELSEPVQFCATPFDGEEYGRELWFRAMKGEYGEIEILEESSPLTMLENEQRTKLLEAREQQKLLEYHGGVDDCS